MVNWSLLKHPMNWIIVGLMVFIAASGFHIAMRMWQNSE